MGDISFNCSIRSTPNDILEVDNLKGLLARTKAPNESFYSTTGVPEVIILNKALDRDT